MTIVHNPPQSLEAEEAVLGAMMLSSVALALAIRDLRPEDFLRETNAVVFDLMRRMRSVGDPVDELAVVLALKGSGKLNAVGGSAYVMDLCTKVPAIANARAYVSSVKDHSLLRSLMAAGEQMSSMAGEADIHAARASRADHPVRAAIDKATSSLILLRERIDGRTYANRRDIGELIEVWGGKYLSERADPNAALAIPFPPDLPQLNEWTMGQRPGRLIVSSGLTGHGKSWFGLDCSETVMDHGGRVAYFSLELPGEEILERMVGMGGISYADIQERRVEWESMESRINWIGRDSDLFTLLDGTTNMARIEAEIISARVSGKPYRYVVIDTINLLKLPGRASDRRGEIDNALMEMKNLAIDHGLTVHAQAQINRDKNRDPMDSPGLADLKESSGIEQTADLVLFVHRYPGVQAGTLGNSGALTVAKGRNIKRRGSISVAFDPITLRFKESPIQVQRSGPPGAGVAA